MDLNAKDIESKALTAKLFDSLNAWDAYPLSRTFVACAFGFSEIAKEMIDGGEDFTVRTRETRLQPLYVAIRHEHQSVQEVIRTRNPKEHSVYLRSMEIDAAVRTGKDTFVLWLLDLQTENLITYGILRGAALHCSATTFRRLQDHCTGPMSQTDLWKDDLLVAAASNKEHGDKIVRLLLPGLCTCSEEAYAAAASNENHGLSILRLLFATFRPMRADQRTVKAAATNNEIGSGLLKLIIAQFPDWKPDEEVIITSAMNGSVRTLEILLEAFSPVHITQEVLEAAASNQRNGLELVQMLLTYEVEVADVDNIILSAMENSNSGSEIVAVLLERFPDVTSLILEKATTIRDLDIRIWKKLLSLPGKLTLDIAMIENAAMNQGSVNELIKLFRDLRKDDLATISNLLAEAIIGNHTIEPAILEDVLRYVQDQSFLRDALWHAATFPDVEVLRIFLNYIDAPESLRWLVETIVANESCGLEMTEMIFADIPGLCVTTEAIEIASQNQGCGHRLVKYLLDRDAEVTVSVDAILAASKNRDSGNLVMPVLLDRFHGDALTEETTVACASNLAHAYELMELLFEHDMTDWSGEPFLTTLFCETLVHEGNFRCLKSLLEKRGDLDMRMEVYGLGNSPRIDLDLLNKLLGFCDDDMINHDLIYRVVSGAYNEDDLSFVHKLLPRVRPISASKQSIYQVATKRREGAAQMLQLLQDSGFSGIVEREMVLDGVRSSSADALVALNFSNWPFKCDEEVLEAAALNRSQGVQVLRFLWSKQADLQITEGVLKAAAQNKGQGVQVLGFLWIKQPGLQITEDVLKAAAGNKGQGVQVFKFLWSKQSSLQITEDMLGAAARNKGQGVQVLKFLWSKQPDLQITEDVLKAAAGNKGQGVQVFKFLWSKQASLQITEDVLKATAGNKGQGVQVFKFLWSKQASLQITEDVLKAAAQNKGQGVQILKFLWRKQASLQITEDVLKAAIKACQFSNSSGAN
jgi:hypothetical protein